MTKTAVVLVLTLASAACMGGGGRRPSVTSQPPAISPVEAALLGQWELAGIEAQGRPLQGSGRLSFDRFNNIAVHAELAPGEAGVTPPRVVLLDFAARAAISGPDELTYVGLERRAPTEQMVPQASEPSAWRHFSIEGDTLRVWQEGPNGQAAGVMTFRRVR
ncbi:MAG: hypothetical protein AB7Q16_19645 [Vicinamibacterales bacterium]